MPMLPKIPRLAPPPAMHARRSLADLLLTQQPKLRFALAMGLISLPIMMRYRYSPRLAAGSRPGAPGEDHGNGLPAPGTRIGSYELIRERPAKRSPRAHGTCTVGRRSARSVEL